MFFASKRSEAIAVGSYYVTAATNKECSQTSQARLGSSKITPKVLCDYTGLRRYWPDLPGQPLRSNEPAQGYAAAIAAAHRLYVDTYKAYMLSEAFQKHSQLKQSFETPVENGLVRILRQWN